MNAPFPLAEETVTVVDLRDPGEAVRIEEFVADMAGQGGTPFHRPAWLRAVQWGTGQVATGITAERSGMLTGWLPLTEVASPLFGRAMVSSGFAVGGGPLAARRETIDRLCVTASELALRRSCPTIELRSAHAPADWDRIANKHCGFVADLAEDGADSEGAQLLAIPRKQRAEVRKGLKNDLTITTGSLEKDRKAHYAVYAASVHNLGTPVFPRKLFDSVLREFGENADILTVWDGKTPVASVLSLYHAGMVMPYWGGGTFAARHLRANEIMYYELMLHARRKGCTRFDFGRSKTGSGPYNYKKNWGFEPQPLTYASWTAPGAEKRNIDPTHDSYSRKIELWKRLPLRLANIVGPPIARGLA